MRGRTTSPTPGHLAATPGVFPMDYLGEFPIDQPATTIYAYAGAGIRRVLQIPKP